MVLSSRVTRALRAHTPRAPWYIAHFAYTATLSCNLNVCCRRPLPTRTCARIVGTVDGRGYDGQHKNNTICHACRPCHSILRTLKPVFCLSTSTDSLYFRIAQVPRSQDLAIFCGRRHDRLLYPLRMRER